MILSTVITGSRAEWGIGPMRLALGARRVVVSATLRRTRVGQRGAVTAGPLPLFDEHACARSIIE